MPPHRSNKANSKRQHLSRCKMMDGRCDFRQDCQLRMIAHYEALHPFEWAKRSREVNAEVRMELDDIAFEDQRALGLDALRHLMNHEVDNFAKANDMGSFSRNLEEETRKALADHVATLQEVQHDPKLVTRRQKHWNGVDCEEILRSAKTSTAEEDMMHGSSSEESCSETPDLSDSEEEDEILESSDDDSEIPDNSVKEVDESSRSQPPPSGLPDEMPEPDFEMDSAYSDTVDLDVVVEESRNEAQQRTRKDRYGDNEYKVTRTVIHPTAGRCIRTFDINRIPCSEKVGPWAPFKSAEDFKVGSFFIRHNHTKSSISEGFNRRIYKQPETGELSFASADSLRQIVEQMDPDFQASEWHIGQAKFFADKKNELVDFYYRDIERMVKNIFIQPAYRDHLIYAPVKEYNSSNERVWSDLHTASWWWEQQELIPVGGTLIPLIFASDATQLSTHAGDHDCWPIYMSIGNLPSSFRAKPSTNSWILVGLLPMAPKKDDTLEKDVFGKARCNLTAAEKLKYAAFKEDGLHQVLEVILKRITDALRDGMNLECADGNLRVGYPKVAGWIADYQEYNKLYQTNKDGCALCEVGHAQLGDNVVGEPRCYEEHSIAFKAHELLKKKVEELRPVRKANGKMPRGSKAFIKAKKDLALIQLSFKAKQSKARDNSIFASGLATEDALWKPDMLHTLYQGMVKYILTWLRGFLKAHDRYAIFNQTWLRVPSFSGMPEHTKPLGSNSQMTGKFLRNVIKELLPVLYIALDKPTKEEEKLFRDCLTCVRYLIDFCLVCQYKFHTNTSIGYLETYLDGFHRYKYVFEPFRLPKKTTKATTAKQNQSNSTEEIPDSMTAAELALQAVEKAKRKAKAEAENLAIRALACKRKRKNQLSRIAAKILNENSDADVREFLLSELGSSQAEAVTSMQAAIDALASEDGDAILDDHGLFRIIKLHLLQHFASTVPKFGALQQWSTEIGETLHKGLKEAYRKTNKIDIEPQILRYHTRRFSIRMRELNLVQLAKDGRYQADIQDVLSLYASAEDKNLAAKLARTGKGDLCSYLSKLSLSTDEDCDSNPSSKTPSEYIPKSEAIIPEVEPISLPLPRQLFRELFKEVEEQKESAIGRVFSAPLRTGCKTIPAIATVFKIPHLAAATLAFISSEPGYDTAAVTKEEICRFRTQVYTTLTITTPAIQCEEPFETLKLVCTGPFAAHRKSNRRNDAVLYRDSDSETEEQPHSATLTAAQRRIRKKPTTVETKLHKSDFGVYAFGNMKCMFTFSIPKPEYFRRYRTSSGFLPADCYTEFRFAFVEVLKGVKNEFGYEMERGPELARCILPNKKDDPNEQMWKRHGGRVMEIQSIVRPAHLIPIHSEISTPYAEKAWVVNNRIDVGTWDLIYGNVF